MAADFEILIKTKSDLAAANQLKRALEQQIIATKKLGGDASALEKELTRVNGIIKAGPLAGGGLLGHLNQQLSQLIPGFSRLSTIITGLGAGGTAALAAGIGAVTAGLGALAAGLREFAQAQEATTKLDVALAQTGQLTDAYRTKLQALADQLQSTTGIADEEWLGVLKRLTQFGSTEQTIERDIEAVKNLAGIMEGDLSSAAMVVSKAIQGQFQTLSRYGIVIDENASKAKQLEEVYRQLALRGAGQLEVATKTLTGQFKILGVVTSDFFEGIGGLVARTGIVQKSVEILTSRFKLWGEIMKQTIPVAGDLKNATVKTTQAADDAATSTKAHADELARLTTEAEHARTAFNNLATAMRDQKRQADEIANAKMAVELATIDAAEETGAISPETAIITRQDVRQRHKQEAFDRDQQLKESEVKHLNQVAVFEANRIRSMPPGPERDKLSAKFPEIAQDTEARIRAIRSEQTTARKVFGLETQSGLTGAVSSAKSARAKSLSEAAEDPAALDALTAINKAAGQNGQLSLELLDRLLSELENQNRHLLQLKSRAANLRTP